MGKLIFLFLLSICAAQLSAIKTDKPFLIDGIIEKEWFSKTKISNFKQSVPVLYATPSKQTDVYLSYDENNIYIAAIMYQDKQAIKSSSYRRDTETIFSGDWFQVDLDPYNKNVSGFYFALNPSNSVIDGKLGASSQEDKSWDGVFYSQTYIADDFWSAEIQIPLNSIDFQDEESQTWGVLFARKFAEGQEELSSNDMPKDDIYRMSSYTKIGNFINLKKSNQFQFSPYFASSNLNSENLIIDKTDSTVDEFPSTEKLSEFKKGLDFKYQPSSQTTFLATINPDFAQLESDVEVINISDNPTEYPEKRQFFIFSSDMYRLPSGVNTRRINEIDIAAKMIHEFDKVKFDLTAIKDKDKNNWYLGDFKIADSELYEFELISGTKVNPNFLSSNNVLVSKLFLFNKRTTIYNNVETTYSSDLYASNGFGANYSTREWGVNFNHLVRNKKYNSINVGRALISNINDISLNFRYSFDFGDKLIRRLNTRVNYSKRSLINSGNILDFSEQFSDLNLDLNGQTFFGESLGEWFFQFNYTPDLGQKFRNRKPNGLFQDNFSNFNLVKQNKDGFFAFIGSDRSRTLSFDFQYSNFPLRQSNKDDYQLGLTVAATEDLFITAQYSYAKYYGSEYQYQFSQSIPRIKLEINPIEKLNIRAIYEKSNSDAERLPINAIGENSKIKSDDILYNITISYEYLPGDFVYFVANKGDFTNKTEVYPDFVNSNQNTVNLNSFVFKLSHAIIF